MTPNDTSPDEIDARQEVKDIRTILKSAGWCIEESIRYGLDCIWRVEATQDEARIDARVEETLTGDVCYYVDSRMAGGPDGRTREVREFSEFDAVEERIRLVSLEG